MWWCMVPAMDCTSLFYVILVLSHHVSKLALSLQQERPYFELPCIEMQCTVLHTVTWLWWHDSADFGWDRHWVVSSQNAHTTPHPCTHTHLQSVDKQALVIRLHIPSWPFEPAQHASSQTSKSNGRADFGRDRNRVVGSEIAYTRTTWTKAEEVCRMASQQSSQVSFCHSCCYRSSRRSC